MTATQDTPPTRLPAEALRRSISGRVIEPGDPDYDAARQVQNAVFDRHPALIVRVASAEDVARTIAFARDAGFRLSVRGGGHGFGGRAVVDGAVVIDFREMRGIQVDPERRLAWAEAGLTAGEYTAAAAVHGLATPFGDTASVGIAGITLGGGIGYLTRKHGLTIDSLVSVELVTADGEVVIVDEASHPDLFWAIRGGGGNFGVVTRFQYRLFPLSLVVGGALFLPATRDVLRGLVPIAASAPEELTMIANLMPAPPLPFIPAEAHGHPTVAVLLVHAGDVEAGQRAVAPLRALAAPIADVVGPDAVSGHLRAHGRGGAARARHPAVAPHRCARRREGGHHSRANGHTELAASDHPDPGARRRHGADPGRRHGLRPPEAPGDADHHHALRGRSRGRPARSLDPGLRRGARARRGRRLCQLPWSGGRGSNPGGLSGGHVRAPGGRQAALRPSQRLHCRPGHPARRTRPQADRPQAAAGRGAIGERPRGARSGAWEHGPPTADWRSRQGDSCGNPATALPCA